MKLLYREKNIRVANKMISYFNKMNKELMKTSQSTKKDKVI